jgi:hypothetical protein
MFYEVLYEELVVTVGVCHNVRLSPVVEEKPELTSEDGYGWCSMVHDGGSEKTEILKVNFQ